MMLTRELNCEYQMRALMESGPLNEMLSLYAGTQGSRNCLLICHQVSAFAPGKGPDRVRFYHSKEVAIAFVYEAGQWWWGEAAKQRWMPTRGGCSRMPPLKYMDMGALYVPAEADWIPAASDFTQWSMFPQRNKKFVNETKPLFMSDIADRNENHYHMLNAAYFWHGNRTEEDIAAMIDSCRLSDPRALFNMLSAGKHKLSTPKIYSDSIMRERAARREVLKREGSNPKAESGDLSVDLKPSASDLQRFTSMSGVISSGVTNYKQQPLVSSSVGA